MIYLHRAERNLRPFGLAALQQRPVVMRGLVTGLVGAVVVGGWFFVRALVAGAPLHPPAALGSALLLGAGGSADVSVSLGLVATYTVVHFAAFVVAGVALVALAEHVERVPAMAFLVVLAFIVLEALVVATLAVGAEWGLGTIGWWAGAGGELLAVLAIGWQGLRTHSTPPRPLLHQ